MESLRIERSLHLEGGGFGRGGRQQINAEDADGVLTGAGQGETGVDVVEVTRLAWNTT